MPYKKLSELTEHDVSMICSNSHSCATCILYQSNMTSCLTDNNGKFLVMRQDITVYVPSKEGKHCLLGQGRLL